MNKFRYIYIIIALALIIVSLFFKSTKITVSLATGSAITIISYELLCFVLTRLFAKEKKSVVPLVFIAVFKLLIIGLIIWFIVINTDINIIAFLVGLSTILLSILFYSFCDRQPTTD